MKNSKKGISLIVLVITIIVIIILAAAVLLSIQNNNPINNSKKAVRSNDEAELKSAFSLYISNFMAEDANHASPFGNNKSIKVSNGSTKKGPTPSTTAGTAATYVNEISYGDLGVSSNAITEFTFNTETNEFTFTYAPGYATLD